jgi:hypothetical protein
VIGGKSVHLRCAILAALVLAQAHAPSAWAWTAPPRDDAGRVAFFDPVARSLWAPLPCEPVIHTGPAADSVVAAEAASGGTEGAAVADAATCEIWIRSGLGAYEFCVVLAHEYGHLAGYVGDAPGDPAHSADPHHLMFASPPRRWRPCLEAAVPPLAQAVKAMARRSLRGRGWRLVLIRNGRRSYVLVAHRGKVRHVWDVWGGRWDWEMVREVRRPRRRR